MKTFRNLKIDDNVYFCDRYAIEYDKGSIRSISKNEITFDFSSANRGNLMIDGECLNQNRFVSKYDNRALGSSYDRIVFILESEAIRYCKSNLLKELRIKIVNAKKAIKEVVDFRSKNIQVLNSDWIESEIIKLEKIEREIL